VQTPGSGQGPCPCRPLGALSSARL
jgi:hypothetical protein